MTPNPPPSLPDPLFLVGCQRSGSHIVSSLLAQESDIAVVTETFFIPLFAKVLPLAGDLSRANNRQRLAEAIFVFLGLWEKRNLSDEEFRKLLPFSLLSTADQIGAFVQRSRNYGDLVRGMGQVFTQRLGKRRMLEKHTYFPYLPLELMDPHFPAMKVVHIVRDGRDVSLSWRNIWFGPRTVTETARRWCHHVRGFSSWGANHPERYAEIRYEHFLADPAREIATLKAFFDVGGAVKDTRPDRRGVLAVRPGHAKLAEPVAADNRMKWQRQMPPADYRTFMAFAADELARLGYETPAPDRPLSSWDALAARLDSNLRHVVRPVNWKRWAVMALPALLLLPGLVGLPITRLLFRRMLRNLNGPS